jgi:hypothetical protein
MKARTKTKAGGARLRRADKKISVGATRDANNRIIPGAAGNGNGKPQIKSFWETFEGARAGSYRGWFFLPTPLDTSKQMTQWTRMELAKRNVWAYNNIPEMRAVIDGLAVDEVDTAIWPKARTENSKFNRAVTDRFDDECKDPRMFDLRQIETGYSAQFLIRRTLRLIGDMFGQLVRPLDAGAQAGAPPRMGFLPGYQCTSDGAKVDDYDLREGIRFDPRTSAPLTFRFALPKRADKEKQEYTELPADDVLFYHDPFFADQIRGVSTLAPVTRQMFSMDDIDRAETSGQLLRSRVAYAVETIGSEEGEIPRLPGVVATEVIENPDGTKTIIQKVMSRDGSEVDVITPPSGMKIKTLESNRGGAIDFRNFLARGLAHCTLYPPEWILFVAGLGQGTVYRGVQNRAQKIANFFRAMQIDPQFMTRWYRFWLWKRISAGIFDNVEGGVPARWWVHKMNYPRDMSVDLGRDGRLYDDRVMRGNMSDHDYHALSGRDNEDVDEEIVDTAIRRRKLLTEKLKENPEIKIDYEEVWKLPVGAAAKAAVIEAGGDPNAPSTNGNGGNP